MIELIKKPPTIYHLFKYIYTQRSWTPSILLYRRINQSNPTSTEASMFINLFAVSNRVFLQGILFKRETETKQSCSFFSSKTRSGRKIFETFGEFFRINVLEISCDSIFSLGCNYRVVTSLHVWNTVFAKETESSWIYKHHICIPSLSHDDVWSIVC